MGVGCCMKKQGFFELLLEVYFVNLKCKKGILVDDIFVEEYLSKKCCIVFKKFEKVIKSVIGIKGIGRQVNGFKKIVSVFSNGVKVFKIKGKKVLEF